AREARTGGRALAQPGERRSFAGGKRGRETSGPLEQPPDRVTRGAPGREGFESRESRVGRRRSRRERRLRVEKHPFARADLPKIVRAAEIAARGNDETPPA